MKHTYVVTEVHSDTVHGLTVHTFGPFLLFGEADAYRRTAIERNVTRYPVFASRPKVEISTIEPVT